MALANGIQDPSRANEDEGESHSARAFQDQSEDSQDGPEELHVVEPDGEEHTTIHSPRLSEDEQLRQRLVAATSGAEQSLTSAAPIGF